MLALGLSLLSIALPVQAGRPVCDGECLREKAMSGDGEAALQLADDSLKTSHEVMVYWYRIAAENGNATGQYNYGVFLVDDSKRTSDCVRALFWFKKAAAQGKKIASDYIGPLEEKLSAGALDKGCVNII
jgi:TPR repeat protein